MRNGTRNGLHSSLSILLLAIGLLVTTLIYYPGLSGPFFFDDILHIQGNPYLQLADVSHSSLWSAAFSTNAGPLQRPVSMLSFALNNYFFGADTLSFKITNLIIHLLNGLLIFLLAQQLLRLATQRTDLGFANTKTSLIAGLIAILWLVHPINLTSVLYAVQRMTSLSALFVLLSLLTYIKGRLLFPIRRLWSGSLWLCSAVCALLALASKENAVLLPLYIFLIEWLFFYSLQIPTIRIRVYTFAWLLVPLAFGLTYLAIYPGTINYDLRPFTLWERILTEARALWFYIGLIILPRPAALGIFHDDFPLSTGLFDPATTFITILGLLLVFGFAVRYARRLTLLAFGMLFFLAAHALESTIFSLEIMHEHRNYLASFGILFGLIASIGLADSQKLPLHPKLLVSIALVFFTFLSVITHGRAINWQSFERLVLSQVNHHPESASSNYEAGRLYIALRDQTADWLQKDDYNAKAIEYFSKLARLTPYQANGPLAIISANATNSKTSNQAVIQDAVERLQSRLLRRAAGGAIQMLIGLSDCERRDQCFIPQEQLDALLRAPLENPQLSRNQRAALTEQLALQAGQEQNFVEAEKLFLETINLNNINVMYRLNYAALLIHLGRHDEAKVQIEHVGGAQPQPILAAIDDLHHRMAQTDADLIRTSVEHKEDKPPLIRLLENNNQASDEFNLLR